MANDFDPGAAVRATNDTLAELGISSRELGVDLGRLADRIDQGAAGVEQIVRGASAPPPANVIMIAAGALEAGKVAIDLGRAITDWAGWTDAKWETELDHARNDVGAIAASLIVDEPPEKWAAIRDNRNALIEGGRWTDSLRAFYAVRMRLREALPIMLGQDRQYGGGKPVFSTYRIAEIPAGMSPFMFATGSTDPKQFSYWDKLGEDRVTRLERVFGSHRRTLRSMRAILVRMTLPQRRAAVAGVLGATLGRLPAPFDGAIDALATNTITGRAPAVSPMTPATYVQAWAVRASTGTVCSLHEHAYRAAIGVPGMNVRMILEPGDVSRIPAGLGGAALDLYRRGVASLRIAIPEADDVVVVWQRRSEAPRFAAAVVRCTPGQAVDVVLPSPTDRALIMSDKGAVEVATADRARVEAVLRRWGGLQTVAQPVPYESAPRVPYAPPRARGGLGIAIGGVALLKLLGAFG